MLAFRSKERPIAVNIFEKIDNMYMNEYNNNRRNQNPTKIIESSDIGPVTKNNPGAVYKSRPLSGMIRSAMSTRSLRSQSVTSEVGK